MQLGLSPGEDNPPDLKPAKGFDMRLKVLDRDLPDLPDPPDVAHHTTAVAAIVGEQNQDGQGLDAVIESLRSAYGEVRNCVLDVHGCSAVCHAFAKLRAPSQHWREVSAQPEMKDKNSRQGAGRFKEVALPCPREYSPL